MGTVSDAPPSVLVSKGRFGDSSPASAAQLKRQRGGKVYFENKDFLPSQSSGAQESVHYQG